MLVSCARPLGILAGSTGRSWLGQLLLQASRRNGGLAGAIGTVELLGRHVLTALVQVSLRWMLLHVLPALPVVDLHPVILAIFHLAGVLESLREKVAEVVVVRCVLEAEVTDVREIFVKFLC